MSHSEEPLENIAECLHAIEVLLCVALVFWIIQSILSFVQQLYKCYRWKYPPQKKNSLHGYSPGA